MIASYEEYNAFRANVGKVLDTPAGPLHCCGCGMGGDREGTTFSVVFGSSAAPSHVWTTRNGFETELQRRNRVWDETLLARSADELELLNRTFGAQITDDGRGALKTADKLVEVAKTRLVKAGKLELGTCGRCGGTGHYSYNQTDGTRCFGCAGSGKRRPTVKEALKAIRCE